MTELVSLAVKEKDIWKVKAFEDELSKLKSNSSTVVGAWLISQLPDYFFHVAASSTGKYHPAYTTGDGGLLRHSKAAVRIAVELMRVEMYSYLLSKYDYILIALMIHDGWKHGPQTEDGSYREFTDQSHSKICYEWLVKLANEHPAINQILLEIAQLVLTHMGQWNVNTHTGEQFAPKPQTQEQCFVHLCDYLASRRCLEFDFSKPFGE